MKFVGLFKGEFKILDNIDPSQLEQHDTDFAWIDIDRIDAKTQLALKKLGLASVGQFGLPIIYSNPNYDFIRINYFEEQTKRELEVYMFDKYFITVHQGKDSVCEEAMASVNEMLVSGEFNAQKVLHDLFSVVIGRHELHIKTIQESLRSIELQLKKGISNVTYLSQLSRDSKEILLVFEGTKSQLADIVLKAVSIRGLDNPDQFSDLYGRVNNLLGEAEAFSDISNQYINELISFMWGQLTKVRSFAIGLAMLAVFIGVAALFFQLFPETFLGIDSIFVVIFLLVMGGLGLVAAQRSLEFTLKF